MESMHPKGREHAASSASRTRWVFWGFVAIAAFFLLTEHRAHVLGILPFLLLLACPLMHLFHHRRHGGGDDAASHPSEASGPTEGQPK